MKTRIPFIGPSYAFDGSPLAAQESINYFLEVTKNEAREPVALIGTPGLTAEVTGLNGGIKGLTSGDDLMYVAAGTKTYKVDTSFSETELGSIPDKSKIYIVEGSNNVIFCDVPIGYLKGHVLIPSSASWGYVYNKTSLIYSKITDSDFNPTTKNYQFFINETAEDFTSYNASEFDSADVSPDKLVGISTVGTQAVLFGSKSVEFWYYSGATAFPFAQQDGAAIDKGCISPMSIAQGDSTIFWVGNDLVVYMLNGFSEYRISNAAIEDELSKETDPSLVEGFYHFWKGHKFYSLYFPTSGKTWVFDALLSADPNIGWHRRKSDGVDRWLANSATFFSKKHLVGSYTTGKIYSMSKSVYQEDGNPLIAERTGHYIHADNRSFSLPEFQLTVDVGNGLADLPDQEAQISLSISKNDGHSFGKERTKPLGKNGEKLTKVRWTQNGRSKTTMCLKTRISGNTQRDIVASTGRVEVGI